MGRLNPDVSSLVVLTAPDEEEEEDESGIYVDLRAVILLSLIGCSGEEEDGESDTYVARVILLWAILCECVWRIGCALQGSG